jgi:hypothetical protein
MSEQKIARHLEAEDQNRQRVCEMVEAVDVTNPSQSLIGRARAAWQEEDQPAQANSD